MQDKNRASYVYLHRNVTTGEVFYVGKGKAFRSVSKQGRSSKWKMYVIENNGFSVEYVKTNMSDSEACALEIEMMALYSGTIVNVKNTNKVLGGLIDVSKSFEYDPSSPTFLRWKLVKTQGRNKVGDVAGGVYSGGYSRVMLNRKGYSVHRLVWVMHNCCEIPDGMVINHIDCDPVNNSIENLECVSYKDNNRRKHYHVYDDELISTNVSGTNGVYRSKTKPSISGGFYYNWTTIVYENEESNNRSFSVLKYGEALAKEMAIAWRKAKQCSDENKLLSESLVLEFNEKYKEHLYRDTPKGVCLTSNHGIPAQKFAAYWYHKDTTESKHFSIKKYGYDEAYRLACEWRKQMEDLYYNRPE